MALSLQRYMDPEPDCNSKLLQLLKERSEKERERSAGITLSEGYDRLDDGVIFEILSWLPVRSLLRYKSVCKSWHAIISSPDFISKHLNNYCRNDDDNREFLISQYYTDPSNLQAYVMFVDETEIETPRVVAVEDMVNRPIRRSQICGPCDGLYYLFEYCYEQRVLWNPAINELRELPPLIDTRSDPHLEPTSFDSYGFGFDSVSRDYKVVVIRRYRDRVNDVRVPQSVVVYSLNNDCWTFCGDLDRFYWLVDSKCYNMVNGCYYWLSEDPNNVNGGMSTSIVCFDLATNGFEEIKMPKYKTPAKKCIGIYNDSLAVISFCCDDYVLEIWTLMSEGIWSLNSRIGPLLEIWSPIGHWRDDYLMFEADHRELALLHPGSRDIKKLSYKYTEYSVSCHGVYAFKESLVSVKVDRYCETSESEFGISKFFESESELGSEYGIRKLFGYSTSESDSELGIQDLFCADMIESYPEYGIQDLFEDVI